VGGWWSLWTGHAQISSVLEVIYLSNGVKISLISGNKLRLSLKWNKTISRK
jgi:hypothetical protein